MFSIQIGNVWSLMTAQKVFIIAQFFLVEEVQSDQSLIINRFKNIILLQFCVLKYLKNLMNADQHANLLAMILIPFVPKSVSLDVIVRKDSFGIRMEIVQIYWIVLVLITKNTTWLEMLSVKIHVRIQIILKIVHLRTMLLDASVILVMLETTKASAFLRKNVLRNFISKY